MLRTFVKILKFPKIIQNEKFIIYNVIFYPTIHVSILTLCLTLWKSLALLSRTVNEWPGFWSPLKMKDMSPLSHLMSLKSTRVVSILIEAPLLWILHISDGNTLETNGTERNLSFADEKNIHIKLHLYN